MSYKIARFESNRKYMGIMEEELNKRKINKRAELIEIVRNFWNDLDQEVTRDYVESMT